MNNTRTPFWLTASQIAQLDSILLKELDKKEKSFHAENIKSELSIASPRFKNGRFVATSLATVLGHEKQSVPVRLSSEEIAYLTNFHPKLPQDIIESLR